MNEIEKVLKPNVYVFAFHLIGSDSGKDNPLWNWADDFLANFTDQRLKDKLEIPEQASNYRVDLLQDIRLGFEAEVSYNDSQLKVGGFAFPLQIGDSYALWLNVGFPDIYVEEVSPQWLSRFNPQNLLGSVAGQEFLGETILITAKLPLPLQSASLETLQSLADKCCNALLPEKYRPPFNRNSKLFGSPIFEYGLIKQTANYRHLLVWFPNSEESEDKLGTYQQEILDLFYYRNKIIKYFQGSRQIHSILSNFYRQVEDNIGRLQQRIDELDNALTSENLEEFKAELKKLLKIALPYTQCLTKLEDYGNTIAINLNNYNEKLAQIRAKLESDKEELSILNHFSRKTVPYMRSQIAGDLGYFKHGTNLIESAIASIRGIVEIEQARSDRAWQEEENKSDRDLQTRVTLIGVGVGVSGVVATAYPYLIKQDPPNPINFALSITFSLCLGIVAALAPLVIQKLPHLWSKKPRN